MQAIMLKALMSIVVKTLSEELLKKLADKIIDFVEDAVIDSDNKIDDAVVLPILKQVREAFDIKD